MSQAASSLAWDMMEKAGKVCGFIESNIHLYACSHGCFSDLAKPLACSCIHLFLATGRTDLGGDIPNNTGRLTSGERNHGGSWFGLSIVADGSLHECFLLDCISGSN